MGQKKTGTADYTVPAKPERPDVLKALDAEYELRTGKVGIAYVSRRGDGSVVYLFGTGEQRKSRSTAIRYLQELLTALDNG